MNNLILKHLLLQHVLMVIEESESITYSHQLSGMIQGLDPMTLWVPTLPALSTFPLPPILCCSAFLIKWILKGHR